MTFLKLIIHHLNSLNCLKYFIFYQIRIIYFSKCYDLNECHICEVMCHCLRLPLKIHCTIGSTLCFCYVIRKQTWYYRKIFFFILENLMTNFLNVIFVKQPHFVCIHLSNEYDSFRWVCIHVCIVWIIKTQWVLWITTCDQLYWKLDLNSTAKSHFAM